MTDDLTQMKCQACEGWMKPFTKEQYEPYLKQIDGWDVLEEVKIKKEYKFSDFAQALAFVNKVGRIAEKENHHPNIYLYGWNKVRITLTTHAINGLSSNDFIMAAKIDKANEPVLIAQIAAM